MKAANCEEGIAKARDTIPDLEENNYDFTVPFVGDSIRLWCSM